MTIKAILHAHFSRYPAMQIQDVYKLIHQAVHGSEHAISNPEGARQRLESELAKMDVGPEEPLFDLISAHEQIVRVHLRPFIVQDGDPEMLLDAFIRTANEFRGNPQILNDYWKTAIDMEFFSPEDMDTFIESMQKQNYPALHHSTEYERLYRPAYRVVLKKFIA